VSKKRSQKAIRQSFNNSFTQDEPEVAKAEEVEDLRSQRRERKSLPFEEKSLRERKLKIETEKGGETHQAKRSAQKEGERRSVDTKGHLNLTIPLCIGGIKEIGVHVNLSSLPPDRQRRGEVGKDLYLAVIIRGGPHRRIRPR
jgi:hypothetical protein